MAPPRGPRQANCTEADKNEVLSKGAAGQAFSGKPNLTRDTICFSVSLCSSPTWSPTGAEAAKTGGGGGQRGVRRAELHLCVVQPADLLMLQPQGLGDALQGCAVVAAAVVERKGEVIPAGAVVLLVRRDSEGGKVNGEVQMEAAQGAHIRSMN